MPSIAPVVKFKPVSQKPNTLHQTYYPTSSNYAFSYPICAKTNGAAVVYGNSKTNICSAHDSIKADLQMLYDQLVGNDDDASKLELADVLGKALRLVFHDAVDLDMSKPTDVMGGDGCLGDALGSAGLIEADSAVLTVMEPIYQKYCDKINRADFIGMSLFYKFPL